MTLTSFYNELIVGAVAQSAKISCCHVMTLLLCWLIDGRSTNEGAGAGKNAG
jgi:hypothetical protein